MRAKSTPKKKADAKNDKSFEESLWDSANRLRPGVHGHHVQAGQDEFGGARTIANLGEVPADTFFKDQHPDLKADYIMANPPFNMKDWRKANELTKDSRWDGYETPPTGNANYGWILHMVSKLSTHGVAGFVLANGSMSTNTTGEGTIRQKLVENDLVDCMIALPGQLFYTTQIPVCLWFLSKSKKADKQRGYSNREGKTLSIDARQIGSMISRTQKELTETDIARIADTYHAWRSDSSVAGLARVQASSDQSPKSGDSGYTDQPGYCKSATLEEIRKHDVDEMKAG